jgi:hypothetical protein
MYAVYLVILACFSISNGYLSALLMVAGLEEPSLEADEIDVSSVAASIFTHASLPPRVDIDDVANGPFFLDLAGCGNLYVVLSHLRPGRW